MAKAKYTKDAALAHWRSLSERQDALQHMEPIPYRATGSRYGACGIRIDGSPEFIDAVLSNLKSLLAGESVATRLELSRNRVDGGAFGKSYGNAVADPEVCYIRLHDRGREGAILQSYMQATRMTEPQHA